MALLDCLDIQSVYVFIGRLVNAGLGQLRLFKQQEARARVDKSRD